MERSAARKSPRTGVASGTSSRPSWIPPSSDRSSRPTSRCGSSSSEWGNDYAMIANPRDLLHYKLEPGEMELLPLMDGTRTVKEIVVERFRESGDMELSAVADLVRQLQVGNFLTTRFQDVDAAVRRAMVDVSAARLRAREFAKTQSIDWKDAHRLVDWFYRTDPAVVLHPVGRRGRGGGRDHRVRDVLVAVSVGQVLDLGRVGRSRVPPAPGDELLPHLHARARARGRPRALQAAGEERRVHALLRFAGVLRRVLRRVDARSPPADRAVVRRAVHRADHRRCRVGARVGLSRIGRSRPSCTSSPCSTTS